MKSNVCALVQENFAPKTKIEMDELANLSQYVCLPDPDMYLLWVIATSCVCQLVLQGIQVFVVDSIDQCFGKRCDFLNSAWEMPIPNVIEGAIFGGLGRRVHCHVFLVECNYHAHMSP
jgi:hypothetical protein